MGGSDPIFYPAGDQRIAAHATGANAAFVFATDGARALWANGQAAALFGANTVAALVRDRQAALQVVGQQIARLAGSLPYDGGSRLERLRGIGTGIGPVMACLCSRIKLADGTAGVLVVATERAKSVLSLAERVGRLIGDASRVAAYSPEGHLVFASPSAAQLDAPATIAGLGADALAASALDIGHATGVCQFGPVEIARLGEGASTVLVVRFAERTDSITEATMPAQPTAATHPGSDQADPSKAEILLHEMREPIPTFTPEVTGEALLPPATPAAPSEAGPVETAAPVEPEPTRTAGSALPSQPLNDRRSPLRFVWQLDAAGCFTMSTPEFAELVGGRTTEWLGRPWRDLAAALELDAQGRLERAFESHDTFSGIVVMWPIDGCDERLTVELSGLPVFDRNRTFGGYRGFGICRNVPRAEAKPAITSPITSVGSGLTMGGRTGEQGPAPSPPPETPAKTPTETRPTLTIVPPSKNVVPFRGWGGHRQLSSVERTAFHEIAKALGARLEGASPPPPPVPDAPRNETPSDIPLQPAQEPTPALQAVVIPSAFAPGAMPLAVSSRNNERDVLDRLPIGILIYRLDRPVYANRTLLDWTGHPDASSVAIDGRLDHIMAEQALFDGALSKSFGLTTKTGDLVAVEGRLFAVTWDGEPGLMLAMLRASSAESSKPSELAMRPTETETRELRSIIDTATDGVIVVDTKGIVLSLNRSAEALFGYDAHELVSQSFVQLFAHESQRIAEDYLDGLMRNGVASLLNDGREVIGRVRQGGLIPLFMTIGRVGEQGKKFCAVFRDITQWKRAEEELLTAKRLAEKASSAKSEFLAKISHEVRTPLNAIIGFSEVMMEERFGPIGNERYRNYLRDIHDSGEHVISLVNDLLDLSKIEAGKLDLKFTSVKLNELVQQCVALMQPQANRERIIIRTSLATNLPPVVGDTRSIRQIMLNLLSNSIKFTGAGGQVIVSTAFSDTGEVILRVRDTGAGMTDQEIQTAMEPFRQLSTSDRWGSGGTGLGLPLTKALAEANRASFSIKSVVNAGTLIEITFPATRVLAE